MEETQENHNQEENVANGNIHKELVNNIKTWIKLDAELVKLKSEIKDKSSKKKEMTEKIVSVMKKKNIDCFDVNPGALVYKQRKTKKPITGKFILAHLQNHFKDTPAIAVELTKQILDSRELTIVDEIKKK